MAAEFDGLTSDELRQALRTTVDSKRAEVIARELQRRRELELLDEAEKTPEPASTTNAQNSSDCFIATACYGDSLHPDVVKMRRWRDDELRKSAAGRALIGAYCTIGPRFAQCISPHSEVARIIRVYILAPLARHISAGR